MSSVAALQPDGDDPSIVSLLEQLYAVISFEEGSEPSFELFARLFAEHARITRITPEGTDFLDPSGFLAMTRSMLELGAYTSFYEFEVGRRVEQFADVAQVWSFYETRRNRAASEALGRGVNSIQLIRQNAKWKVLSLLWDESHAEPSLDFGRM
jgi:hypothetical protein